MALAKCQLVVTDENGTVVDGASIEVRRESTGALVQVYSDRAGTAALGNPFTASDGADAGFFVAGGAYKITASKDSFERIWRYVGIGTYQEFDVGAAEGDIVLPSGATINWDADDVIITHSANRLSFTGATVGYTFDGKIGIGGQAPTAGLDMNFVGAALPTALNSEGIRLACASGTSNIELDAYNGGDAALILKVANGTAAAPSALTANQVLGGITMRGYGATGFTTGGRAHLIPMAAENWTDAAQGTYWRFQVTPVGGTTSTPVLDVMYDLLRPVQDNATALGSASFRFSALYVAGTVSFSASATGGLISALTADATPDPSADYLATHDASAGTGKKVLLETVAALTQGTPGYVTNRYYSGQCHSIAGTTSFTVSANTLYATPFVVGKRATFTRIGIDVTTLSAGNARLGIYGVASDGSPGSLVLDAGTVATGSTGIKEVTISQELDVGFYFLVVVFDATPAVRTAAGGDLAGAWLGSNTPGNGQFLVFVAHTYGALPASFGAESFSAGAAPILMFLRVV